ncbi:MAG: hypothetical protein LKI58_11680 [Actinomyces sp.]|jgi:hypothetical protein|nr:hypothetical protein [Actinomyces sp.]MCI1788697.1 hypothetical protein [Actinomyces sp.]MCI1829256.1 hypothetical protein [Actinomyces sp.]
MASVDSQIRSADDAITGNIGALKDNQTLLSQNLLLQIRNSIKGLAAHIHNGDPDADLNYATIKARVAYVRSNGRPSSPRLFSDLLNTSASRHTLDGYVSARLTLNYYEHLHRIRDLTCDMCDIDDYARAVAEKWGL